MFQRTINKTVSQIKMHKFTTKNKIEVASLYIQKISVVLSDSQSHVTMSVILIKRTGKSARDELSLKKFE
jgi:hypothetical protein